jgi:hypothetical protein
MALSILDLNCTPPPEDDLNILEKEEDNQSKKMRIYSTLGVASELF